jgi:hypothetical protein
LKELGVNGKNNIITGEIGWDCGVDLSGSGKRTGGFL